MSCTSIFTATPAWMTSALADTMPDTATSVRKTPGGSDAFGGASDTVTTPLAGVPMSYKAVTGNQQNFAGSIAAIGDYILRFQTGADVQTNDTITVAARGANPQFAFKVKAVLLDSLQAQLKVLAVKLGE